MDYWLERIHCALCKHRGIKELTHLLVWAFTKGYLLIDLICFMSYGTCLTLGKILWSLWQSFCNFLKYSLHNCSLLWLSVGRLVICRTSSYQCPGKSDVRMPDMASICKYWAITLKNHGTSPFWSYAAYLHPLGAVILTKTEAIHLTMWRGIPQLSNLPNMITWLIWSNALA